MMFNDVYKGNALVSGETRTIIGLIPKYTVYCMCIITAKNNNLIHVLTCLFAKAYRASSASVKRTSPIMLSVSMKSMWGNERRWGITMQSSIPAKRGSYCTLPPNALNISDFVIYTWSTFWKPCPRCGRIPRKREQGGLGRGWILYEAICCCQTKDETPVCRRNQDITIFLCPHAKHSICCKAPARNRLYSLSRFQH